MTDTPERDESGRWLPGIPSPNPGGRPRSPWRLALERVAEEMDVRSGSTAFEEVLRALTDAARGGDVAAARVLLDRLIPVGHGDDAEPEPPRGGEKPRVQRTADLDEIFKALRIVEEVTRDSRDGALATDPEPDGDGESES